MSLNGIFAIGVSGVSAYTASLEAISANIANSQTTGFKKDEVNFASLIPNDAADLNEAVGAGVIGAGVSIETSLFAAEQGSILRTNEAANLAISGAGFFITSTDVSGADQANPFSFTRAGGFRPDAAGNLVNDAGYFLQGVRAGADGSATIANSLSGFETVNINVTPQGAVSDLGAVTSYAFDADGFFNVTYANGDARSLFRVPLALFRNENALDRGEGTSFLNTTVSGDPRVAAAGQGRAGILEGSAIEASTVDIGEEFGKLISTQRAYSTNARIISIADELWTTLVDTAA